MTSSWTREARANGAPLWVLPPDLNTLNAQPQPGSRASGHWAQFPGFIDGEAETQSHTHLGFSELPQVPQGPPSRDPPQSGAPATYVGSQSDQRWPPCPHRAAGLQRHSGARTAPGQRCDLRHWASLAPTVPGASVMARLRLTWPPPSTSQCLEGRRGLFVPGQEVRRGSLGIPPGLTLDNYDSASVPFTVGLCTAVSTSQRPEHGHT